MYFFIFLSIWGEGWTDSGIDELLIRAREKPVMFTGSKPIERYELDEFLGSLGAVKTCEVWLKKRLSLVLENIEILEWNIGAIEDSLDQEFVLLGKGVRRGFIGLFIEPVAKFGDSTADYPLRRWQGIIASDYLKGYIKANIFNFSLVVGREPIKWGPSPRNTFVISGNSPAFDLIRGSYWNPKLKASFFATQLDSKGKVNRYLSGHRIEYNFRNKLYLGFSEGVLFGGENKFPDLYHLNPLFFYYFYEWNREGEQDVQNVLWGFDFNLFLRGLGIYSELMIDDFPYKQTRSKEHPKIGLNLGMRGTFLKNYWLAEYRAVTKWSYGHRIPWQRYTYLGGPIGHPVGPDFDEIFCGVIHHLKESIDIISNISLLRKGEGTIDEPYPHYFPSDYWLTGELKHTLEFEMGIKWYREKFVVTCKSGFIGTDFRTFPKLSFFISSWR